MKNLEGVPEGYYPVRFGVPEAGELYLANDGKLYPKQTFTCDQALIVRKEKSEEK